MIISKQTLEKIKKIINEEYKYLLISIAGKETLTKDELDQLRVAGFEVDDKNESLLKRIYYHNVLNELRSLESPTSIPEMRKQQQALPQGTAHSSAEEHIGESFAHSINKLKSDAQSRLEGFIRQNNMAYRNNALQNLERPDDMDKLVKESTLGQLKATLRAASDDVGKNFERIAITETSNALGLGSVDRVIMQNKDKDAKDIYVYRIPVNDSRLCAHCRRFYLDRDGSPVLYRLSTLLNNGTNYGLKVIDWKPVVGATHVNDRESGVLQLKPGWKVGSDGSQEYIGQENWDKYIEEKLRE